MSITIRDAISDDAQLILDFIIELAVYENAKHEVKTDAKQTKEAIFGENSTVQALICEQNGEAIGYAVYFYNYSTWLGKKGIYLEDLYISESKRGLGAGKAILKHLAKKAVEENCGRFEWSCLDWNTPSREFYESLGAKAQEEWIGYRLEGDSLHSFAES
ncbi:GNAT family N-acetyltransferase [Halarcobacter anaerophilus]|uniref:GNAT family N-acetyltransferase n=1 Tax=Halarcobacter anaerophilus TaxID=877500 RepID=A0A4Q0XZC2_9BACT|nr:GNAT family N-acetyltransferase [Halarcobacter anaerophilus]QDF28462.1 acetyltransferase (GNAT family) [Halarcobacter anaerophilus]RXJ61311.1 GNAT family N-acetyltransferase [Halarcobacter anaerophilus]